MRQPISCRSTSSTSKLSIMAGVGRRTLPYRLNTGMPCTGSRKSAVSIMLSCLSPRRPCCGPKAADSFRSAQAARASSEWVSRWVTEAGCASNATRRPVSGLRSAGSVNKRSMPNRMASDLEAEAVGVVKIRPVAGMAQGPVAQLTLGTLDDGRDAQPQVAGQVRGHLDIGAQQQPVGLGPKLDAGGADPGKRCHTRTVTGKAVRRPLARGGQVELEVRARGYMADEDFHAGMTPQSSGGLVRIRAGPRAATPDPHPGQIPDQLVLQRQPCRCRPRHPDVDMADGGCGIGRERDQGHDCRSGKPAQWVARLASRYIGI